MRFETFSNKTSTLLQTTMTCKSGWKTSTCRESASEWYVPARDRDFTIMSKLFSVLQLIGQYLALRETSSESNMIGLIDLKSSPYDIARQAIQDASYICNRTHGDAPEVHIYGRTDLHFPYVSSHISYIMLELLKNSMRATIETHGTDNMPPIRVIIADGEDNEDVSVVRAKILVMSFLKLSYGSGRD